MADNDIYQERYLAHIERKRQTLRQERKEPTFWDVLQSRRSQRVFRQEPVDKDTLERIYQAIRLAPSSCNRQAILISRISAFPDRAALEAMLVGGEGWLSMAPVILLLFADMRAYKSPAETDYMPWLDAGFVAQNVYLAAEALGLGCCYVNPHIKGGDVALVNEQFNPLHMRFCGAIALGYYDERGPESPKRDLPEIFYLGER